MEMACVRLLSAGLLRVATIWSLIQRLRPSIIWTLFMSSWLHEGRCLVSRYVTNVQDSCPGPAHEPTVRLIWMRIFFALFSRQTSKVAKQCQSHIHLFSIKTEKPMLSELNDIQWPRPGIVMRYDQITPCQSVNCTCVKFMACTCWLHMGWKVK